MSFEILKDYIGEEFEYYENEELINKFNLLAVNKTKDGIWYFSF